MSPWTASEREQFARLIERLDTIGEVLDTDKSFRSDGVLLDV